MMAKEMNLPTQCLGRCIPPVFRFRKQPSAAADNVNNSNAADPKAEEESAWSCSDERETPALDKALELNYTSSTSVGDSKFPFQDIAVIALLSDDPYVNFRISMEEMMEDYGFQANQELKDWNYLESLLAWYLRMNTKTNHGFIVAAFLDMLVSLGIL